MKSIVKLSFLMIMSIAGFTACGHSDEAKEARQSALDKAVKVEATTAQPLDGSSSFYLSAKVVADKASTVSAKTMGYVENIQVDLGERVSKGQKLLTIRSKELDAKEQQAKAMVTEASAALENTKKNYDRIKVLFEQNSATQKEWDDISAAYKMVQAKHEAAKQMLEEVKVQQSYTVVKAPANGMISAKLADVGDLASPGRPLFRFEQDQQKMLDLMVPIRYASAFEKDQQVDIYFSDLNKSGLGTVDEIGTSSQSNGGQLHLRIKPEEGLSDELVLGMLASVKVNDQSAEASKSVWVPKSALVTKGQLVGVYVISDDNVAVLRWLRTGKEVEDKVEVLSGLSQGERIVNKANAKLVNGQKVEA